MSVPTVGVLTHDGGLMQPGDRDPCDSVDQMRMYERWPIRVTAGVIAVAVVAGGARAAHADLTVAALLLLVTVLAVGTLGLPSGLAAAGVGFLALNWFFTEPTGR